jgi:hypothetical protein
MRCYRIFSISVFLLTLIALIVIQLIIKTLRIAALITLPFHQAIAFSTDGPAQFTWAGLDVIDMIAP